MSVDQKYSSLIFIPFPVISHLVAAVKAATLLSDRDERLSVTILVMKLPIDTKIDSYTKNSPKNSRINFLHLPENECVTNESTQPPKQFGAGFIESQKGPVREAVSEILEGSIRLAGFVVDMFCTAMIDVADGFNVPSYVFFPCSAASLGLMFHLQSMNDDHGQEPAVYKDTDAVVSVPTYVNPVPARVWPDLVFRKGNGDYFLNLMRKFRHAKGIIVNTFLEFEPHAVSSLSRDEKIPPVYPIGPIIQEENDANDEIVIGWLNEQPDSSVVFLCFGSKGSFDSDQVKEIAVALENCGSRFLWSLRKPPPKEKFEFPGEYEDPGEVLPEGFLERTVGIGKVVGWAPQMAVLSHPAVGGFVSHCGWNSTLESVWCGVPMAVWPLAAEQQANAFQLVREFGMAVEIKMDYRKDSNMIVDAEIIGKAIERLMDPENGIRSKVKALKEKSRLVLMEGESSCNFLDRLIVDIMDNVSTN
ncbi:hypothetical protein ACP275_13G023900 [Erythranthe tilingii]